MIRIKNTLGVARLPSAYQEVEYLQSTGSQHIDTTVCPTTDFYCKVVASFANESDYVLCGVYYYSGTKRFAFGSYNKNLIMNSISNAYAIQVSNDQDYHTFIIDNPKGTRSIDSQSATSTATDCIKPFFLFKRNSWYGSNDQQIDCGGNIKLKSCEMINNGVHYNFVPCYRKSDNVPGMYDLVNGTFYTNAGSGTFLIGNEVSKRDININPAIFNLPMARGYINGKLFYGEEPEQIIEFSSSIVPTNWTEVTTGKEYTSTNSYGEWRIWADNYLGSDTIDNAFDGATYSLWESSAHSSSSSVYYCGIKCPDGTSINPTSIYLEYSNMSSSLTGGKSYLQGLNTETNEWENLGTLNGTSSVRTDTFTFSDSNFYSEFRLACMRYSSSKKYNVVYEFQIKAGTIKM